MTDWHYATLLETADAIRSRKISPVELTKALLERIARLEPSLHSYATVTPERASAQARQAEAEIAAGRYRGPLHGIPIAVKDICNTAGVVTAAGMAIHSRHVPDFDATVVKRLADAGAVLLGKLQLTEGAFVDHHPTITPPRNPWNAHYYAGASSSGSGVATAAGLCFASLGSDTGGSIRFPCSANGIIGLKPTWGRVSRHGVFALAASSDHVGPMTRSAADAGAMLGAIAGFDPNDPTSLTAPVPDYLAGLNEGVKGLRIGVDAAYNETGCDPEIIATMREARKVLEDLGAVIKEVKLPNPEPVIAAWGTCVAVEVAIAHEPTYPARAAEYGGLAQLIEAGRAVRGIDLMKAHHERLAFSGALAALFRDIDLLLVPTQPRANFTLAQEADLFATPEGLTEFLRFTTPFDMSGSPTITLPGGFTSKGLPLSFQLVGRHLDESMLVRAGHTYQQATDWHRQHPPLQRRANPPNHGQIGRAEKSARHDEEHVMSTDTTALPKASPLEVEGDPHRWLALPALLIGAFLPVLDFNVVNLALPAIRQDLGATSSEVQFVISAYAATYAVFLITGGRLGDWLGRKRMFLLGVAGFTLASILCGIAWSPGVLIAGRILQGLTATAMAPQVLASIRVLFAPSEQGKALGLYGATFGLANILGQILGGVLVSLHPFGLTWQAIFLINVPIGLAAFLGGLFFLSESKADRAEKLDMGGVVLLSATLSLLVYPLVEGRESGWPVWMVTMLVVCPIALLTFIRFERRLIERGGAPLVDMSLFRERGFAIGVAMALLFYMLSSFYLTFSVYLQGGLRLTPFEAGLRTLPFAMGYFLASFAAAGIMQRLGPRALTLGFAIQMAGFGAVALTIAEMLPGFLDFGLAVAGVGFGIVMPSVIKAVIGDIDQRHAGLASGIVISMLQIGAALGVAVVGGIFFSVLGAAQDLVTYTRAFTTALGCNVVLLAIGGVLSLWLPGKPAR